MAQLETIYFQEPFGLVIIYLFLFSLSGELSFGVVGSTGFLRAPAPSNILPVPNTKGVSRGGWFRGTLPFLSGRRRKEKEESRKLKIEKE